MPTYIASAANARRKAVQRFRADDPTVYSNPVNKRIDAKFAMMGVMNDLLDIVDSESVGKRVLVQNNSGGSWPAGTLLYPGAGGLTAQTSVSASNNPLAGANVVLNVTGSWVVGQTVQITDGVNPSYAVISAVNGGLGTITVDWLFYAYTTPTVTALPAYVATAATQAGNAPAEWVTQSAIANGAYGYAVDCGEVTGIDTHLLTLGALVYLSTAGAYTTTAPTGADVCQQVVGVVKKSNASGSIYFFPGNKRILKFGTSFIETGSVTFDVIGSGTNTTATMTVGSGGSVTFSGTGVVNASQANGVAFGSTTATSGNLLIGSGTQWVTHALSGDVTITSAGVATVGQINGVALGSTTATSGNLLIGSGTQWVTHALSQDVTITSAGVATINKFSGTMILNSVIQAPLSTGQNNWAPTGWSSTVNHLQIACTVASMLTGLSSSGFAVNSLVLLSNYGGAPVTLAHSSSSSTLGNRFVNPNDIFSGGQPFLLPTGGSVWIKLDGSLGSNYWFVVATMSSTAGGDLSGVLPDPTVAKINGVGLGSTTATSGNLLIGSGTQWVTQAVTGDATITSGGVVVVGKVNGSTVPAGGSLTTGNVLQVTGGSALGYAAVNLAGGANFVTGTLPIGNGGTNSASALSGGRPIISNASAIVETSGWQSQAANYTVVVGDCDSVLDVDASAASRTITLLAVGSGNKGFRITIRRVDSAGNADGPSGTKTVTIQTSGTDGIDGVNASSGNNPNSLCAQNSHVTLRSTGVAGNGAGQGWIVETANDTVRSYGTGQTLGANTPLTLAKISLPPGEWDVSALFYFTIGDAAGISVCIGTISTTSSSLGSFAVADNLLQGPVPTASFNSSISIPAYRQVSTTLLGASTWSHFAVGQMNCSSATTNVCDARISARRFR